MLAANNWTVRHVRGASRKQHGFVAGVNDVKKCDGYAAVGARRNDADVTGRGFSRGAWMGHRYTGGGVPICDVCKRVGHVARSCWQRKASASGRRGSCGGNAAGLVLHSVVKNREYEAMVERYLKVSVNSHQVEALVDYNALENAVALKTVKVDPRLKIYDLSKERKANSPWLHTVGMVWLPVVIGSRVDKLRCVVVDGLTEELIIGLPGLSFLGASINFATGDVRISRRGRKVEGCTTAVKGDKMHDDHTLVRGAKIECTELSPEDEKRKSVCTKRLMLEQVKDLAGKVKPRDDDDDRGKGCRVKPNQEKKVDPVSGRGRKEGKVNVVSPKATTTTTTTIIRDHDDEESEGECDSGDEVADKSEELKQRDTGSAKVGKRAHKAKRKKGKKKKGNRKK